MNNPFFVLSSEDEIIAVIHNVINNLPKGESAEKAAHEKLIESVRTALWQHYDRECGVAHIPADYSDHHKPIEFKVLIGSGPG